MNVFLQKRNTVLPKILIVIVVFIFFLGFLNVFQKQFKNFFYFVSNPLQKICWSAGNNTSLLLGSFLNFKNLSNINQQLANENRQLLEEVAVLQNVKIENESLREAINAGLDKEYNLLLVGVSGLDSYQDFVLIDRGLEDGILEGMPVINSQNVLFGKVFKVYKNFSKVMLISNKDSVLDVKIQKDDTITPPILGAIRGKGNLNAYLDLVPLNSEIKNDDVLITSSLEGAFPKNLLVGQIVSTKKDDLKPFQTASVKLFLNFKQTENLFVITNYMTTK